MTYAQLARLREDVAARPDSAAALCALGSALWRAGQREEGLARLQQAVQADPTHPNSLTNLGNVGGVGEGERGRGRTSDRRRSNT